VQPATENFGRLRELFHDLVDRTPEEREERLTALAATDADLLPALRELLAVGDEADAALAGAVGEGARDLWREDGGGLVGRRIGPWEVVRLLGHGGMGSVFLARRADGAFTQQVALKLVRSGFATANLMRRFQSERRTLAALEHPNIARLLDGGTTDDDQPYLVMEYVDGVDVEAHCEAHELPLGERIELFLAVCAAVEHAHRNLVVHRDLKPGNVLVTAGGVPKLLDFGIAKLLAAEAEEETRVLTQAASTLGTIAFASPEQVRGEAVSTATDVYSLGVILYRLLTGKHPYALGSAPLAEVARIVCEVEPLPPSRAVLAGKDDAEARRRARELRGDLDTIVLMALEKEAARRYPSVAAMAEDLRRHRDGLPIVAAQPSRRYRAGKFVRRHRVAVVAATLVLLSLVGGLAGTLWSARRAREAARRADLESAKAEQVSDFLADMFSSTNVGWRVRGNREVSVAEVLASASERLSRDLRDQPEVEARLRHVLGESYVVLLDYRRATQELERALVLDLRLYGEQHLQTARARTLLGWVLTSAGDVKRGAALLDQGLATYRRTPSAPPAELAEALGARGYAAMVESRLPLAETYARQAVELTRTRLADQPLLPLALTLLGGVQSTRGDVAAAEHSFREALTLFSRLPDPDRPEKRAALLNLGGILSARGELDQAERLLREALALTERYLGPEDVFAVEPHFELGLLAARRDDGARAEAELRHGLAIQRRHTAEDHPMLALGKVYLGRELARQARYAEAEPVLRQALAAFRAFPGLLLRRAQAEAALAACLSAQDRFGEAEPLALAAYEDFRNAQSAGAEQTQQAIRDLVRLYEGWQRPQQAAAWSARLANGP
jgi:serine/threonine-protein kinase